MDEEKSVQGEQGQRKTRSDKGTISLSERDLWVLTWIAQQYVVRADQLETLLGARPSHWGGLARKSAGRLTPSSVRSAVARWKQLDIVRVYKFLVHEPPYVYISRNGLRQLALNYSYVEPAPVTLHHLHQVNLMRELIEQKRPNDIWKSERTLRLELPQQGTRPHVPDAVLIGEKSTCAIEVELSSKSAPRLQAIVTQLLHSYKTVWYFLAPELQLALQKAIAALPVDVQSRIQVYDLEGRRLHVSSVS